MRSYIVRIYRKDKGALLGVVEEVEGRKRHAFTDSAGLWNILNNKFSGKRKQLKSTKIIKGHPPDAR